MANLRTGTFGEYYGSFFNESEPLTSSEMKVNAKYLHSYLSNQGWSLNAIAGMLGNIQAESTINPGRWQSEDIRNYSMGYGLVQWTPATKYFDWLSETLTEGYDPSEMDNNLARIIYEVENNLQWIATDSYNYSFKEFSTSNKSVAELSIAFLLNYERPADQSEEVQRYRASLSEEWYLYLSGNIPEDPSTPVNRKKKKFNFLLFTARKRRETWIKRNL